MDDKKQVHAGQEWLDDNGTRVRVVAVLNAGKTVRWAYDGGGEAQEGDTWAFLATYKPKPDGDGWGEPTKRPADLGPESLPSQTTQTKAVAGIRRVLTSHPEIVQPLLTALRAKVAAKTAPPEPELVGIDEDAAEKAFGPTDYQAALEAETARADAAEAQLDDALKHAVKLGERALDEKARADAATMLVSTCQAIVSGAWDRVGDILPKDDPAQAWHERLESLLNVLIDERMTPPPLEPVGRVEFSADAPPLEGEGFKVLEGITSPAAPMVPAERFLAQLKALLPSPQVGRALAEWELLGLALVHQLETGEDVLMLMKTAEAATVRLLLAELDRHEFVIDPDCGDECASCESPRGREHNDSCTWAIAVKAGRDYLGGEVKR